MLVFRAELARERQMNGRRHTPEQIIHRLRQAEVELRKGSARAARQAAAGKQ